MNSSNSHICPSKAILMAITAIYFSLGYGFETQAQVEVINGGFEISKGIPNQSGLWQLLFSWGNTGSATANPDFYHIDGTHGGDLPETPLAYIQAYNGDAIAGLEVSRRSGSNMREYLSGRFSQPLDIGKRYEFSFALANGDVYEYSAAGLGVSELGITFSTEELVQTDREPLSVSPNFKLGHVHYYEGWKIIKFVFTADEAYVHFTFGMFGDDNGKVIQSFEGSGRSKAYYFVDDFSIRDLTSDLQEDDTEVKGDENAMYLIESNNYVPTAFTPNFDGVNDVFMPSLKANRGALLRVYDRGGAMVWESDDDEPSWGGLTLLGGEARQGVYVWTLTVMLEDGSVEELRGPVTLLQ